MSNLVREIEIEIVEPNSSSVDATAAAASAAAAATSATAAATSATAAATSATAAATSATSASTQATNAATSATAAATSATSASTQATNAATSATAAATSATNAATSATSAASSATEATTNGAAQVTLATAQVALATTQANNAAASYDSFDDRYLGAKSSNPSVDNDGGALITGALYFNTTVPEMRVWNGSAWVNMPFTAVGALLVANNLSDLASAATARTNLGVAIGSNVQAYSAELAALAGLTSAVDKVPYFTGSGTAALADFTSTGRSVVAGANAAAILTTLGIGAVGLLATVPTASIDNDAVTYAKFQNISTTDRLIGLDGAAPADATEITVGGGLEFTGTNGIQRSALTGDVTATAGGTALTIPNDTVTFAKMQNSSGASKILGRGSAAGAGDFEELTISTGLTLTGTVLTAGSAAYGSVAAWCRMNGTGTPALTQSLGITSITDNGVGDYTLTFNYTLAHANFTVIGGCLGQADGNWPTTINLSTAATPTTTTTARFVVVRGTAYVDVATLYVAIIL